VESLVSEGHENCNAGENGRVIDEIRPTATPAQRFGGSVTGCANQHLHQQHAAKKVEIEAELREKSMMSHRLGGDDLRRRRPEAENGDREHFIEE